MINFFPVWTYYMCFKNIIFPLHPSAICQSITAALLGLNKISSLFLLVYVPIILIVHKGTTEQQLEL